MTIYKTVIRNETELPISEHAEAESNKTQRDQLAEIYKAVIGRMGSRTG
jgi:hypothetical protein